jgi:hypothetical protein
MKVFLLFLFITLSAAQASADLRVRPISAPHREKLTEALAEIGSHVKTGFTSFGVVINGTEPLVDIYLPEETNLSTALQHVISQVPGYTFERVSSHLVDVYPQAMALDTSGPLNLRVAKVQIAGASALDIFAKPYQFIPELKAQKEKGKAPGACGGLGPGLGSNHSKVEIALQNVTVKQILDAVAIANANSALEEKEETAYPPVGWVLRSDVDSNTGSRTDTWSFLLTVPHGWRNKITSPSEGK